MLSPQVVKLNLSIFIDLVQVMVLIRHSVVLNHRDGSLEDSTSFRVLGTIALGHHDLPICIERFVHAAVVVKA